MQLIRIPWPLWLCEYSVVEIVFLCTLVALLAYAAATARAAMDLRHRGAEFPDTRQVPGFWFGTSALACHLLVAYLGIVTAQGFNFSLFDSVSVVAAMAVAAFLFTSVRYDLTAMSLAVFPLAAAGIAAGTWLPGNAMLPEDAPAGLQLHVFFSLAAYSLLAIAALQAVLLGFADSAMKHRRSMHLMQALPPVRSMESLLFHFIGLGFFLLTLGLGCGLLFIDDLFAQHLVHKTVLSILAWVLFAVLLIGRAVAGWRGKIALRYVLAGFGSLLLAFIGTKLMLEVILQRT